MKTTLLTIIILTAAHCLQAAGPLVGVTATHLITINPTNLSTVSIIGSLDLPPGVSPGPLTFHRVNGRLYGFGSARSGAIVTNQHILEFDLLTGKATVIASLGGTGRDAPRIETFEYVDSLGVIVGSRDQGNIPVYTPELVRLGMDGTITHLVQTDLQDNDYGVYDETRDMFYTIDPNGPGQLVRVNLQVGSHQNLGVIPPDMAEMAFASTEDAIYALGYTSNSLYRITTTAGGAPISIRSLGSIAGDQVLGLAFAPLVCPRPSLAVRVSSVEICWDTIVGAAYQLQYQSDLTTNQWVPFAPNFVPGTGGILCSNDTVLVGQPQRYYRVQVTNCVSQP